MDSILLIWLNINLIDWFNIIFLILISKTIKKTKYNHLTHLWPSFWVNFFRGKTLKDCHPAQGVPRQGRASEPGPLSQITWAWVLMAKASWENNVPEGPVPESGKWVKVKPQSTPRCSGAVSLAQSCPTLCDPKDCGPPGSRAHGIFWARILEWVAISFSRGSFQPRVRTHISSVSWIWQVNS